MQNALYFPHVHVRSDRLLKSALLLWDQLEFITPWENYVASYGGLGYNSEDTKTLEHAHRLMQCEHVPSEDEKRAAHTRILDLATTPNQPAWLLNKTDDEAGFAIHFEKLFDDTWKDLERLGITTKVRYDGHLVVPTPFGRATMTILAQCCAGNDTQLVTDSARATDDVRQTTEIEERKRNDLQFEAERKYFSAIDTLNLIDVDQFTLSQLVEFRESELRQTTPYQQEFRRTYWEKLDKAAQEYRVAKNGPERKRVRQRLQSALRAEFAFLKEELGLATAETLFTADTAALVTLGTVAVAAGGPLGIAAAGVTGLRGALGKYTGLQSKRNAALQKRAAAAYMYVFKHEVNAGKPLTSRYP